MSKRRKRPSSGNAGTPPSRAAQTNALPRANWLPWGSLAVCFAAVAPVIIWGMRDVLRRQWVGDDAFISFRYALNLVRGNGLVFNIGERVEGYTNFLWTVLIAFWMRLDFDPVRVSLLMGMLCYAVVIAAAGALSWRLFNRREPGRPRIFIPVAALALSLHRDFHDFATSGLETMMFALWVFGGFALLVVRRPGWAGAALALASMTRPEGPLFFVMGGLILGLEAALPVLRQRREPGGAWAAAKPVLWFAGVYLALYFPVWLGKFLYYGYPFPNTYYAKGAGGDRAAMGWHYFRLYAEAYRDVWALPALAGAALVATAARVILRRRHQETAPPISNSSSPGAAAANGAAIAPSRAVAFTLVFLLPYWIYTVRVGGDFMFARFFVPVLPVFYFAIEALIRHIGGAGRWRTAALILALPVLWLTAHRVDPFARGWWREGVTYERHWYPAAWNENMRAKGRALKPLFAGHDVHVAYYGQEAMMVYEMDVPVAIEAEAGLTDATIARLPGTSRMGHKKDVPFEYFLKRRVHFVFQGGAGDTLGGGAQPWHRIRFGPIPGRIVCYDRTLMDALKKAPGVQFTDFPAMLDQYIAAMDDKTTDTLRRDYARFRDFYFRHNDDPAREAAFQERLSGYLKR